MEKLEKILGFELISIGDFSLSVYNIFVVALVLVIVKIIVKSFEIFINKKLGDKGGSSEGQGKSILQIIKYLIYILAGFITVKSLGLDVSVVGAFIATLGLGLGFALQDLFKDIISGVIILFEGNVKVGDILEVDGLVGTVKGIKLRTSELRTRDGINMVIPNNKIINENVINWSASSKITRFNVDVGVAYGSDVKLVNQLLLESVETIDGVLKRPNPGVIFNGFGDSSLDFQLWFWSSDPWGIEPIKSQIRTNINDLFIKNNIQIPFPQRDIHIIEANNG